MTVEQFPKRGKTTAADPMAKFREVEAEYQSFANDVWAGIEEMAAELGRRCAEAEQCAPVFARWKPGQQDAAHQWARLAGDVERLRSLGVRK